MFYEDLGEFEKSYQLSLIAAYLSPQDADEWLRLAEVKFIYFENMQYFDCKKKIHWNANIHYNIAIFRAISGVLESKR